MGIGVRRPHREERASEPAGPSPTCLSTPTECMVREIAVPMGDGTPSESADTAVKAEPQAFFPIGRRGGWTWRRWPAEGWVLGTLHNPKIKFCRHRLQYEDCRVLRKKSLRPDLCWIVPYTKKTRDTIRRGKKNVSICALRNSNHGLTSLPYFYATTCKPLDLVFREPLLNLNPESTIAPPPINQRGPSFDCLYLWSALSWPLERSISKNLYIQWGLFSSRAGDRCVVFLPRQKLSPHSLTSAGGGRRGMVEKLGLGSRDRF